jgi:hypothetical protein
MKVAVDVSLKTKVQQGLRLTLPKIDTIFLFLRGLRVPPCESFWRVNFL